ncbi:hypothetical protein OsI_29478 [Oryza sativa Indica Group]|uniref:Uncharacterized protein n=1 Tax=Oryza sativa subsp. indica TaxID=39946 RepID=A2YVX3_ORYSI|nr:hypothetical protein OsI_29478 [Oryza sativa Indica Group]
MDPSLAIYSSIQEMVKIICDEAVYRFLEQSGGYLTELCLNNVEKEFCAKHKKDMADEHPVISSDSMFLKAILPTLNVSPCNPLTITGGAGSSTVTAAAFAGGSSSPAPLQVLVFQQQSTGNGNVEISFNSNASPMAM